MRELEADPKCQCADWGGMWDASSTYCPHHPNCPRAALFRRDRADYSLDTASAHWELRFHQTQGERDAALARVKELAAMVNEYVETESAALARAAKYERLTDEQWRIAELEGALRELLEYLADENEPHDPWHSSQATAVGRARRVLGNE